MTPELTIVIPVRDRAALLPRTLHSVAATAYRPLHLVLIDNGSTDASMAVCQKFADTHATTDFTIDVLSEPVAGAPRARNRGLAVCRTEYVYFFDSDDELSDCFVGDVVEDLRRKPCDVLCVPVVQVVDGKELVRTYEPTARPEAHILNAMLSTCTMIFRTEWLRRLGGWDEQMPIWQDWELGLRVLLAEPNLRWRTDRAYHRLYVHPDSITGASFAQTYPRLLVAMQHALADLQLPSNSLILSSYQRSRCLRALYFRSMIFSGKLRCEGSQSGEKAFLDTALQCLPHPLWHIRTMGQFLKLYSALGGRGAWRIALAML